MLCYVILISRIKWMCLTFLLLYLESLLSFSVQVFQVLRPASLNENILLVVLRGCIMDCQPLLVFIHLGTSCWYNKKNSKGQIYLVFYTFKCLKFTKKNGLNFVMCIETSRYIIKNDFCTPTMSCNNCDVYPSLSCSRARSMGWHS